MENRKDGIRIEADSRLQSHLKGLAHHLLISRLHKGFLQQEMNLLRRMRKTEFHSQCLHHSRRDPVPVWKANIILFQMLRQLDQPCLIHRKFFKILSIAFLHERKSPLVNLPRRPP